MMLLKFKQHIARAGLFSGNSKILATVSGGLDSVVLCHLLKETGSDVSIAHCNFQLRGAESDGDEEFVRQLADSLRVKYFVKRFSLAEKSGKSTQMLAREARYTWFDELKKEHDFDVIVTAHHLDDNIETVLLNLIRGTGHKGLSGIHPANEGVVRPLLPFSRDVIHAYAQEQGLEWREDSSNQKDDYTRNAVRHHLIPKMRALNPSLADTFAQNIERFREEQKVLESHFADVANKDVLPFEDVRNQPSPLLYLWHWVQHCRFTFSDAKDMLAAMGEKVGKEFLSPEHKVIVDREQFFRQPLSESEDVDVSIPRPGAYDAGAIRLSFTLVEKGKVHFDRPEREVFVNAGVITFPMTVRSWQQGDRFQPLGMKGQKKVSDLLIDEKVPLHLKSEQLLVISDEEIVWVVGRRLGERFRINDQTEKILKIELHHA